MDAQHVEDKLRREAKEAWKAYLAEKDQPDQRSSRRDGTRHRMHWIASQGNRWLEVRIPTGLQDLTCMACGSRRCTFWEVLFRALPPGLAEVPDLGHSRALHQGCTIELRSVMSPSWRSCHTRSCRHALKASAGSTF